MDRFISQSASKKNPGDKNICSNRKRKAITLEVKLDVIKRFERNERVCDIVRATGIKESTLRTIRDNAEKIKASYIAGTKLSSSKSSRSRVREIEEMEKLLSLWIEDQTKKQSETTYQTIKDKALAIYDDLKKKSENPNDVPSFSASSGWFAGFKNRYGFHNVKLCSEAASSDEDVAKTCSPIINKLIEEECYNMNQIFNFGETGLYMKPVPSKTCNSKSKADAPGFKAANDRLTVLLGDRKRKTITLEVKLDVIKRFERNERVCDIVRATGINESTLRTIRDNAEKIKASCIAGTKLSSSISSRSRVKEREEMEKLLSVWIEDQTKKQSETTYQTIKEKALAIYDDLKQKSENPRDVPSFSASTGWFAGFKNRYGFHNVKLCGEATSSDEEVATTCSPIISKLIEDECYDMNQLFNFDETGLYRKRVPSRTYISKSEAHVPALKVAKDRLTVLLGSNANGDLKLKPMVVYHSANPRALKGYIKSTLGVHLMESQGEAFCTEDLQQLVTTAEVETDDDEMQDAKPRELSTSVLANALREIQKQLQVLEDNDCNTERSRIAILGVNSYLAPYEQLLHEQRMAKQQKLDVSFKPTPKKNSSHLEPKPSTSAETFLHPNPPPTNTAKDNIKNCDVQQSSL